MEVYCTSKNSGPSYGSDPVSLKYIGSSLDEAIEAVGNFARYETTFPVTVYPDMYSAIPSYLEREIVKFYLADGWWYSIVKITISEK